jgi:hypothetical protein
LVNGFWKWRKGEGYRVFADTAFYVALSPESGGAVMTQFYLHRVTGLAYLLSQLFLAGPWQLFTGLKRFRSLLPNDAALEMRMSELLAKLRAIGKWEPALKYQEHAKELGALIRCGLVEFSATKLTVKAPAPTEKPGRVAE